jgi:hypothetical protein
MMKRLIAIGFTIFACLLVGYYIHMSIYTPNKLIGNTDINMQESPIKDGGIKIDKQSERIEGNRSITVYKSKDNKIWISVIRSYEQSEISARRLTEEIERLEYAAPLEHQWNYSLPTHYIDDHIAASTRLTEVDRKSILPTYRVPDKYVTAIGYPEKNMVLLVISNGDNVTWNVQEEMVNRFKL